MLIVLIVIATIVNFKESKVYVHKGKAKIAFDILYLRLITSKAMPMELCVIKLVNISSIRIKVQFCFVNYEIGILL